MLNEIEEFKAYTTPVIYTAESKRDTSYLGRFTFDAFMEFRGLSRVLTIIARGYMFETETPDTERARRALCAWCSMPEMKKATPKDFIPGVIKDFYLEILKSSYRNGTTL